MADATVPLRTLKKWRSETALLTDYCARQKREGWYVKDCIEAGVPKAKRCRLCRLLGQMDDAIAGADARR